MNATPASSAPDASADASTRIPDLPAGIGGTDPAAPLQYTAEDVAAARDLLERVRRGEATGPDGMPRPSAPPAANRPDPSGSQDDVVQPVPPAAQDDGGRPDPSAAQEPAPVVTLSDEQIAALDGYERRQFVALPWLDAHPEQRRVAAAVAPRGMIAGGQVLTRTARHEEGPRWRAVPEISGRLVAASHRGVVHHRRADRPHRGRAAGPSPALLQPPRRGARGGDDGRRPPPLHRPPRRGGDRAPGRLPRPRGPRRSRRRCRVRRRRRERPRARLGVARPPARRALAATRALTVLTRVRTADGTVQRLSAYATAGGMLTMEALDPGVEDPRLEFRRVGPVSLRALATVLVSGQGAPQ
ncbi:hypothetical protein [Brachybacterium sp. GPGPB12]|uniref:hypothetical protein n=1 Tax=Brachybacterium sp. GPGPB12 TaxID=3023517 RepID=UPI0031344593